MPAQYDLGLKKIIPSFRTGGPSVGARMWLTGPLETRAHQNFDSDLAAAMLAQSYGLLDSFAAGTDQWHRTTADAQAASAGSLPPPS